MGKRGNITLYVIIGVVLVILVSSISYFVIKNQEGTIHTPQPKDDLEPIKKHMTACLREDFYDALTVLGSQGSMNPQTYLATKDIKIAYYYFMGQNILPNKDQIELDLETYIKSKTKSCLNDFSSNKYVVEPQEEMEVDVVFVKNGIKTTLTYPLKVYFQGQELSIDEFETELGLDFNGIYEIINKIIKDTYDDPEWINFENLDSETYEVKIIKVDKSTLLYVITDNETKIGEEVFEYRFAVRYDFWIKK